MTATDPRQERREAVAMQWGSSVLPSEPLKIIAATISQGPMVSGMLSLVTAAQLMGHIHLAGRDEAHCGVRRPGTLRFAAIVAYALYFGLLPGHYVVRSLLPA